MFEWLSKQLQSTLILRPNQTCALQKISRCLLYYARETTKESVRFKWPLRKDRVINKDKLDITKTNRHKKEKKKKIVIRHMDRSSKIVQEFELSGN